MAGDILRRRGAISALHKLASEAERITRSNTGAAIVRIEYRPIEPHSETCEPHERPWVVVLPTISTRWHEGRALEEACAKALRTLQWYEAACRLAEKD